MAAFEKSIWVSFCLFQLLAWFCLCGKLLRVYLLDLRPAFLACLQARICSLFSSCSFVLLREHLQFHCLHSEYSTAPRSLMGLQLSLQNKEKFSVHAIFVCTCIFFACELLKMHIHTYEPPALGLGTLLPRHKVILKIKPVLTKV